jgi:16S rRNA (uracil1498-N3)-methyltransferase
MTRRRFIADEFSGDRAAIIGEHADHLARVLRARVGQEFDIAAGTSVRRGKIVSVDNARVEFELGEEVSSRVLVEITLALSIFKFDRMEWAIEKCTELGVSRIIPVIARRTDAHLASASAKRVERWQRIVRQASEQSRRAVPPEIAAPVRLSEIFSLQSGLRIVLSESEDRTLLHDAVKSTAADGVLFAVGPEGGWADDELQSFQQADWTSASLGNTILRAETAAIAATAIVTSALASL